MGLLIVHFDSSMDILWEKNQIMQIWRQATLYEVTTTASYRMHAARMMDA